MTPRALWTVITAVCLVVVAVYSSSSYLERKHEAAATVLEQKAAVAQAFAQAAKAKAEESDRQVAAAQAATTDADSRAASAKRELAAIRASLPKRLPFSSETPVQAGEPGVSPQGVDAVGAGLLQATIDKQDEVIAAQDAQIKARDVVIADLTVSRDQWKATAKHLQDQVDVQKNLSEEYRKAIGAGERKASIKWGAIGLGIGFIAGRR